MERDSERARAVLEALDGAFRGDGIVVAVAAVGSGSSGPAFAVSEGLPEDARFEIDQAAGHAMAALVNTHGRSAALLDAVVMAAVKGNDPRQGRPRDTGEMAEPEWDERARALARALLDGDYAGVHQMLPPESRPKLTAERLGQMWQFALGRIGDPGPVSVSCRSQPDGVAALITFTGSKNPLSLLVRFTASGQIAMLRVIAPDEALPW